MSVTISYRFEITPCRHMLLHIELPAACRRLREQARQEMNAPEVAAVALEVT